MLGFTPVQRCAALAGALAATLALGFVSEARATGCLADGQGYLRARIRGALDLDVDWHDGRELQCAGDTRADGHGIRMTFAGPIGTRPGAPPKSARRMRLIFGIGSAAPGRSGHDFPVNVTVIVEGEQRLYSTLGEDKCTADDLRQQPLAPVAGKVRAYRVTVRGFCFAPASNLTGSERIVVTRFDFSGRLALD